MESRRGVEIEEIFAEVQKRLSFMKPIRLEMNLEETFQKAATV